MRDNIPDVTHILKEGHHLPLQENIFLRQIFHTVNIRPAIKQEVDLTLELGELEHL